MEDDTSNNQQKRQRAESGSDEDDVFNKSDNVVWKHTLHFKKVKLS